MSLPPQTTSASPAASGLEVFSTGSEPPCKRSHESRSHALLRAQRHHQCHGFSCCSTSLQLRNWSAQRQVSAPGDVPFRVVRRSPENGPPLASDRPLANARGSVTLSNQGSCYRAATVRE